MRLTLLNQSGHPVPRKFLATWVRELDRLAVRAGLKAAHFHKLELILVFVDEREARSLNRSYRRKDYATDVLSFTNDDPAVLGELVICPTVISRQAREHGLLVREELGYMVLHGFLHLLGFDHEKGRAQAKRMFDLQDQLFEQLLSATGRGAK